MTEEAVPNMLQFKTEEHRFATATATEQAPLLIQKGYEYVTEMNDVKLFKRKLTNIICLSIAFSSSKRIQQLQLLQ
jgi:hypothetical protein